MFIFKEKKLNVASIYKVFRKYFSKYFVNEDNKKIIAQIKKEKKKQKKSVNKQIKSVTCYIKIRNAILKSEILY